MTDTTDRLLPIAYEQFFDYLVQAKRELAETQQLLDECITCIRNVADARYQEDGITNWDIDTMIEMGIKINQIGNEKAHNMVFAIQGGTVKARDIRDKLLLKPIPGSE